jgi:hypothetical protein
MQDAPPAFAAKRAATDDGAAPTVAEAIFSLLVRLFLGAASVAALVVVAMLIGFFSGGSISGLIMLAWVGILFTPIWAFTPLFRAMAGKKTHQTPGS